MLKLDALSCGYGAVRAVHDLSADVPMGSVLALLGPNGAGKTSTIMAIMGHIDIHAGRILYDGADITRRRAIDRTKLGIALVPNSCSKAALRSAAIWGSVAPYTRPASAPSWAQRRLWPAR